MRIAILDASDHDNGLTAWLGALRGELEEQGHEIEHLRLVELQIRPCTGCFGCWVQRPGACVFDDDSARVRKAVIRSDLALMASPLEAGFVSARLKHATDRLIPLVLPFIELVQGECHHHKRYERYPRLGMVLAPEADASPEDLASDLAVAERIYRRTALNLKSSLAFAETTQTAPETLAANLPALMQAAPSPAPPDPAPVLPPAPGQAPGRVAIFNASPRGHRSNSALLIHHLAEGIQAATGQAPERHLIARTKRRAGQIAAFGQADTAIIVFPLYTDSVPGLLKDFIEDLSNADLAQSGGKLAFLVHSGFPEACHSWPVEAYLARLAPRLGRTYLGTLIKGGSEGIQVQPNWMTGKLYRRLRAVGEAFGRTGGWDPDLAATLAKPARFNWVARCLSPVAFLMSKAYWNQQLKKNGASDRRLDRPEA